MGDFSEEFSIELGLRLKNGAIESIQRQLNQISGKTIDINIGGNIDTSGVKKDVDQLTNNINKATKNINPIQLINANARKNFESELNELLSDEQQLQSKTQAYFSDFGKVTTKTFRDAASNIQSFVVQVENAKGEIESLRYKWKELLDSDGHGTGDWQYSYQGSSGSDNFAKVIEQIARQEKANEQQADKVNAAYKRRISILDSLQSKYSDVNASKAITDQEHKDSLQAQYTNAILAVEALASADKTTFSSLSADADAEINKLKSLIVEYKNAEYAANQLRAKPITIVRQDEINSLREFESRIKQSGVAFSSFSKIDNLNALTALGQKVNTITDKESLNEYLNLLSNVRSEWKALVQEQKLSEQQQKIVDNAIQSDYQSLVSIIKEISSTQISLLKSDPEKDANKINVLQQKLTELKNTYDSLFEVFEILAPKSVVQDLNNEWSNMDQRIKIVKAEISDTTAEQAAKQAAKDYAQMQKESSNKAKLALQEEEKEYKNLISLVSKIGVIRTSLVGLDPKNNAQQIEILKEKLAQLFSEYSKAKMSFAINFPTHSMDDLNAKWQEVISNIQVAKSKSSDFQQTLANNVQIKIADNTLENQISSIETKFSKLHINSKEITDDFIKLRKLMSSMDGNDNIEAVNSDYQEYLQTLTNVKNKVAELQRQQQLSQNNATLDSQRSSLTSQIDIWLKRNSAAAQQFGAELENIKAQIASADKIKLTQLKSQFQEVKRQAELAGKTGLSFVDSIKTRLQSLGVYFSASVLISKGVQTIKQMYDNVLKVDTAMTELYRVTDLTGKQYSQLYDSMVAGAKKYNAALNDVVSATAEWVRFGFDANLSEQLAELTVMYQHVTDLDHKLATENLLTAYKGFQPSLDAQFDGDAAAAVEHILDVYDKLNNELPVSAAQIAEGVNKTASVLEEAGATFEQASALIVGGGSVTQDFDAMGNSIKIATLRIHGMKGKLEELGEEVDENIQSVSKIQTQILNLTHGKVNIFEDDGEHFRNIYDVFKDIASVWDSLSDTESAELLELIAGRFYQNVQ